MEPNSQVYGGAEECHSSESGWTMYIGSPFYGDADGNDDGPDVEDNGGDDDDDDDDDDNGKGYDREGDSDDSMASDASSGPSHQGTGSLKHKVDGKEQGNGVESEEANKPTMERQRVNGEMKKNEKKKENLVLVDGQSSSIKVRKRK